MLHHIDMCVVDVTCCCRPACAWDNCQVIGATTIEEYRKYIEKDKALERRHLAWHMRVPAPHGD